ncbi:MAG: SDR family NAD(P)-dependent oxidoreductase [Muribaculaceae bacterium]|nr:SDR family NAD(P)-dependent oxidoreductase [Muribaculaceae bacterium]
MKKIIIIGASSGLGMRVASDFARMGWRVGIAARRLDRLEELKAQFPSNMEAMAIDVAAPDAARRFEDLIELIDGMDVLLYAAGTGWRNPELDPAKDARTVDVNVKGFTAIVSAAFNYYARTANRLPGQIAVLTSVAGAKGLGVSAAYSASKRYQWNYLTALDQLAHARHVNVRITDIRPGFIDTALLEQDPNKDSLPLLMSVDYAAPLIEKAILKQKRVAYIDSRWAVVTALMKAVPSPLWRHISFDL